MEERTIWTTGRRGCGTCITALIYADGEIIVRSEPEYITEFQMHQALAAEFPDVEFSKSCDRGDDYLFMEGFGYKSTGAQNRNATQGAKMV